MLRLLATAGLLLVTPRPAAGIVHDKHITHDAPTAGLATSLQTNINFSRGNINHLGASAVFKLQYDALAHSPQAPAHAGSAAKADVSNSDATAAGLASAQSPPADREPRTPRTPTRSVPLSRLKDRLLFIGRGGYATLDDQAYQSRAYGYLRGEHMFGRHLGTALYVQVEYDEFLNLRLRAISGGGLKLSAEPIDDVRITFNSGYVAEYERVERVVPDDPHPERLINHRWNNSAAVFWQLFEHRAELTSTFYIQPLLTDLRDTRWLLVTTFTVKLNELFRIQLRFDYHHDTDPPLGVAGTDIRLTNGLSVAW